MNALILGLLTLSSPSASEPILLDGQLCHPTRLLIKDGCRTSNKQIEAAGARVLRQLPEIGWTIVQTKPAQLQTSRQKLRRIPGVIRVDLDRAAQPAYDPNDALWPDMWHMRTIKANLAWDHSFGDSSVKVAVIDTGVMTTHPDLAANIWNNPGEIPSNNIDDDNNGYTDDVVGYDFAYLDNDPDDQYGHGTACAGLVAAVQDNSIGVTGVAPRAKIMCLKACLDSGYFYDSMTAPAYLYAANNGAKVLSMSYFSDQVSPIERDGIDYCWAQGVLPVAAAGNSSSVIPYYPGAYENTLSVAAIVPDLRKAGFSNYGTWVDVAAPGVSLYTTTNSGDYTSGFGGTSGATPHVAGLAALLFGARLNATNAEVRNAIEDSATQLNQPPYGEFCNYGLINGEAAINAILTTPAPPKSPLVRYVTVLGSNDAGTSFPDNPLITMRVYGRGFQLPRVVRMYIGGVEHPLTVQKRDYVECTYNAPVVGSLRVTVDGQDVCNFAMPIADRRLQPLVEASSPGATVTGGFWDTLASDALYMTCTRRDDGIISLQGTIRCLQFTTKGVLNIKRRYTGNPATSSEYFYLYDWQSASYPYGNWVLVDSRRMPPTRTYTTLRIKIPDFSRFIDDEGTMYVLIQTTDNIPDGATIQIDQMNLTEYP